MRIDSLKGRSKAEAKDSACTEVRVSGTSPLSFDLAIGSTLTVKEFAPSHYSRPTIGSGFKSKAFLLFHNETKVGRLSTASVSQLGRRVPTNCTVSEVDKGRKVLRVRFKKRG
jgi:hypothetical protein